LKQVKKMDIEENNESVRAYLDTEEPWRASLNFPARVTWSRFHWTRAAAAAVAVVVAAAASVAARVDTDTVVKWENSNADRYSTCSICGN
jgi:hypothetical protein